MIGRILRSGNIRNVMTLSSGTIVAQIIGMVSAPILTRLYLPDEFGAFAIYLNGVLLISTISCLRYEMTIILVKQHRTAVLLVFLSALIASTLSLGLWGCIAAFEDAIHAMVGLGSENHLLFALPVSLILVSLYKIAGYWAVRNKDFAGLSLSKIWQSLPQTTGQISLGLFHCGVWGLVIGEMVGRLLGLLTLVLRSRKALFIQGPIRLQRGLTLLSYYRQYPLYSTWSGLINEAGSVAPVFFLATLYGGETAGLFALVQRVFALPMDLVGQTASTFYTAEASKAIRTCPKTVSGLFVRTVALLLALAVIPVALLLWSGPRIFDVVFGPEWHTAGIYAQIMAIAYGVRLAIFPISQTMQMLGKQRLVLFIEATRLLSIIGVFACAYVLKLSVEVVLTEYSAILVGFYVCMFVVSWRAVKA